MKPRDFFRGVYVPLFLIAAALPLSAPSNAKAGDQSLNEFLHTHNKNCYVLPAHGADHIDHILVGCGLEGYYADREVAWLANVSVAMLPEGLDTRESTPVVFMAHSYPLGNGSLTELAKKELEIILKTQKGARLLRMLDDEEAPSQAGECSGAEIAVNREKTRFPFRRYFFCKGSSIKYAIMLSIVARSPEDFVEHYPAFLKWADVPQHVRDYEVITIDFTSVRFWTILLFSGLIVLALIALPIYLYSWGRKRRQDG